MSGEQRQHPQQERQEDRPSGHQADGLWPWRIIGSGLGLLAIMAIALVGLGVVVPWLLPDRAIEGAGPSWSEVNTGAGVAPNQAYDREKKLVDQQQALHTYRWQDAEKRVARVPIDRAIEMMAERELQTDWQPPKKKGDEGTGDPR